MNTDTENKKVPDYGEPWWKSGQYTVEPILDREGDAVDEDERAIQCVNACAGMTDPAVEIAAMREAVAATLALAEWSARYPRGVIYSASNRQMDAELIELEERAKAATAKLQPFIK